MSSVTVIIGIIILLASLVCYAFVAQAIQVKKEKRKRLLAALSSQLRNFKFVLSGCPDGFLSKELKSLVLRSLIEVCEQLSKLQPKDPTPQQDLQIYTQQLTDTQRSASQQIYTKLESPQQIKDVKMSLEELHRFVFNLEGQGRLTRSQGDVYRNQIKQLVLRVTVDGYTLNGQAAKQAQKTKLALHYYDLALKLLTRENQSGTFTDQISQLQAITEELGKQLTEEEKDAPLQRAESEEAQAALDDEWSKFADDRDSAIWKKKQLYD